MVTVNTFLIKKSNNLPISVEGSNGLSSVLLAIVVDKSKTFALSSNFVLSQEDSCNVSKRLEQFLNKYAY